MQAPHVLGMRWNPAQGTVETEYADGRIRTETTAEAAARIANAPAALRELAGSAARAPHTWVLTPAGAMAHPALDIAAVAARLRASDGPELGG